MRPTVLRFIKSIGKAQRIISLFCHYMQKTALTERKVSAKVLNRNPTKTLGIKEVRK